jgi:hypothetical protein
VSPFSITYMYYLRDFRHHGHLLPRRAISDDDPRDFRYRRTEEAEAHKDFVPQAPWSAISRDCAMS